MNPYTTLNAFDRQAHDLAVSYIKSNSDLLNTNIEEFVKNCPEFFVTHTVKGFMGNQ